MLHSAVSHGHISGVLSDLIPGGVSHIQYADDTVIMIEATEQSIRNLKLILYCFEWLTGLKINYHKSEVFVFGVTQLEKEKFANMLNCVLGEFPMKYLGIPLSYKHLNMSAFSPMTQKMVKRLDPWKGKLMTSGGRQILTNSCLSSIPLYCMGFYLLKDGVHKKMDSIRAKFLWQGADEKFKYHMAKFEMVCRPKDQGGLGIINTKIMNECLLVKWIWKIYQQPDELWFKILKAKYLRGNNFFDSRSAGGSQFWKGLHSIKHLFKWGAVFKVGNGKLCRFWEDCWLQRVPLKLVYNDLYNLIRNPFCHVADCWDEGSWGLEFKRCLSIQQYERWLGLLNMLNDCSLTDNRADQVLWALEKKNHFTTKSLYRFLTDRGVKSRLAGLSGKAECPLKLSSFFGNSLMTNYKWLLIWLKRGGKEA